MKKSEMVKSLQGYIEHFIPIADPKIAEGIITFLEQKGMMGPSYKDYTIDALRNSINSDNHKDERGKYVYTRGWEEETK